MGTGNEYIDAIIDRMIKRENSGNTLSTKINVKPSFFLRNIKGFLATYIITSMPIMGGKQSFDGVEFIFYDKNNDKLYDTDSDIKKILEIISDENNHQVQTIDVLPSKDALLKILSEIENYLKSKLREGRIGSIHLNSLSCLHFNAGD